MRPNDNNEEEMTVFERLVGDFRGPKSTIECLARNYGSPNNLLMEPIQGSIGVYNEDELTETHTWVDTASGMPAQEFGARFLDIETEENR